MKKIILFLIMLSVQIFAQDQGIFSVSPKYVDLTGVADSSIFIVKDGALIPKTKAEIASILGITGAVTKIYRALLTQAGDSVNSVTATVLENTIGNIVWTRTSVGQYKATLSNAFTENKTFASIVGNLINVNVGADIFLYDITLSTVNQLYISVADVNVDGGFNSYSYIDNMLILTPVEIIVYP